MAVLDPRASGDAYRAQGSALAKFLRTDPEAVQCEHRTCCGGAEACDDLLGETDEVARDASSVGSSATEGAYG